MKFIIIVALFISVLHSSIEQEDWETSTESYITETDIGAETFTENNSDYDTYEITENFMTTDSGSTAETFTENDSDYDTNEITENFPTTTTEPYFSTYPPESSTLEPETTPKPKPQTTTSTPTGDSGSGSCDAKTLCESWKGTYIETGCHFECKILDPYLKTMLHGKKQEREPCTLGHNSGKCRFDTCHLDL